MQTPRFSLRSLKKTLLVASMFVFGLGVPDIAVSANAVEEIMAQEVEAKTQECLARARFIFDVAKARDEGVTLEEMLHIQTHRLAVASATKEFAHVVLSLVEDIYRTKEDPISLATQDVNECMGSI